ncbi:hypothetical protein BDZ91DRAFT_734661 [Kalaharituber pfeilii]|nr:hypothetical protein BDZ91DRAFT_734661 [Kalaharituber pfeilii]
MQMVQSLYNTFLWNMILTGAEMAERQRNWARAESVERNETQGCITVSSTASV